MGKAEELICGIFGVCGCDPGSEPEVRFVFHHVSVHQERKGSEKKSLLQKVFIDYILKTKRRCIEVHEIKSSA